MKRWAPPALALVAVYWLATTVGPTSSIKVNDLYVYSVFIAELKHGVPYRDFGFEYPPLALLPIWLPSVAGGSLETWFAVEMLLFALVAQEMLRRMAGPRAAWLWVLMPVAVGAQVRTHFDLAPVAVLLGALWCLGSERPRWGFALLGVGTLVKLFPVLLAPVAFAWLWGRGRYDEARDGLLWCFGVIAVGVLPFLVMGGLPSMLRFHLDRPIQIESTPASLLFGLGGSYVTGTDAHPDDFRSNGLDGGHAGLILALCTLLMVTVIVVAILLAARNGSFDHLVACTVLVLLAFVGLGKVLSPQYMIWLAPFAILLAHQRNHAAALWLLAALLLTQTWFPGHYFDLVAEDSDTITLVALRNFCLLMALGLTARNMVRRADAGPSGVPRQI